MSGDTAVPETGFRTFVILWSGQFVSLVGSSLSGFALGVHVYQVTGSATLFGLIYAMASIPFIAASLFTGSMVDRWGARRALVVGNAGGLLVTLVLALLLAGGAFVPWHVSVIVACLSILSALQVPAFEASVPLLVPKRRIGRANGMRLIATSTSQILGPVVAGFLLLVIGIDGIVVMDCLTFGWGLITLTLVRIPQARRPDGDAAPTSLLGGFRPAWRYVASRPGLLALLTFVAALEFCAGFVDVLITPVTLAFGSSGALGTVLTFGGIGMALTSLAVTAWGGPRRRVHGVLGFSALIAVATVLGSLRPSITLMAVAAFVFLGSLAVVINSNQSLWQTKVEPHLLGRVISLQYMVAAVPQFLSFCLAGLVADQVFVPLVGRDRVESPLLATLIGDGPGRGFALLMLVMGILLAVCVVVAYLNPRLRNVEDELPDVTPEDTHAASAQAPAPAERVEES